MRAIFKMAVVLVTASLLIIACGSDAGIQNTATDALTMDADRVNPSQKFCSVIMCPVEGDGPCFEKWIPCPILPISAPTPKSVIESQACYVMYCNQEGSLCWEEKVSCPSLPNSKQEDESNIRAWACFVMVCNQDGSLCWEEKVPCPFNFS